MIDAHIKTQSTHDRWLYIQFTLTGESLPPDSYPHDCCLLSECGPYLMMQYNDTDKFMMFDATAVGWDRRREKFTVTGVVPLLWLSSRAAETLNVPDEVRHVLRVLVEKPLFAKAGPNDSDLLTKAMIAGASVASFAEQSPTARLFGGAGSKGYVLTLPDSTQKHVLEAGDAGLPVLDDDARVDIHRFLAR